MVRIDNVRIRNITSISGQIELQLGKRVTILIGPNNAGKSNILSILEKGLNSTSGQFKVDSEFVNETARLLLDQQNEPDLLDIAGIEIDLHISEDDREIAVQQVMNILSAEYRQKHQDAIVDWTPFKETLRQYCNALFETNMTLKTGVFKRTDDNYYLNGHQNNFFSKKSQLIEKYQSRWSQLFAERNYKFTKEENLTRFLQIMYDAIIGKCNPLPRSLPSDKPASIETGGVGGILPGPEKIREYLVALKEPVTAYRGPSGALESIREVVQEAFPDIDDVIPTYDITKGEVMIMVRKGETELELGTQGDGLKQLLMSLAFMHNQEENLLVVDEPENHLHPKLEPQMVDFFLSHGQGQLVIATHSERIVSSIPESVMATDDVVIYGISLNSDGSTQITRGSESEIIQFLDNLGVVVSRYLKYMAALSSFLLFVEGPSDVIIIEKILRKFKRLEEFESYSPLFVPLGGVEESSKIGREVVDMIAKGDDTLTTPSIPFLVILDRDESRRARREYEFILSVREIENLVISHETIANTAKRYFNSFGLDFDDEVKNSFECYLSSVVRDYLNKWTLLKIRSEFGGFVRPLLRRQSTGDRWKMSQEEVISELSKEKEIIEESLEEISGKCREDYVSSVQDALLERCFNEPDSIDYDFICTNLPGKAFLRHILPTALFDTTMALKENEVDFEESRARGIAGSICNVQEFLSLLDEIPPDMERLLEKLDELSEG